MHCFPLLSTASTVPSTLYHDPSFNRINSSESALQNLLTNTLEYSNLERPLSNILGTKQLLALLPRCTSSPLVVCKLHLLGDGGTIQVAVRPLPNAVISDSLIAQIGPI